MKYYYENRYEFLDDYTHLSIYLNDNFSYRAHWHTEFELVYVVEGCIDISINNDRRKLVEDEMAIIRSGDIHYFENIDSKSKIIILVFKPEFFGLGAEWPEHTAFISSFIEKDDIEYEKLNQIKLILDTIILEKRNKEMHYELVVKGKVIELCGLILRYIPNTTTKVSKTKLASIKTMQTIIEYIEGNYTESITLQSLAKQFNMDPYNLSKKFNRITGNNLKTYINTLRLSKAEALIKTTNKSLIDIAMDCGFESIRTFNRTFKVYKGIPPSVLRKD